jgi:hypothetical protein
MYKLLMWSLTALLLLSVVTWSDIGRERTQGPVFIASNGPVSEDQIQQKPLSEGWDRPPAEWPLRARRLIEGRASQLAYRRCAQTGRLRSREDGGND